MDSERSFVLAAGSHPAPGYGMCAVEAASLLAGEDFSDRPSCVCPVLAAFVRGWNDRLRHAERQRLLPYVPRLVGSRGDRALTRERRELFLRWADANGAKDAPSRPLRRIPFRLRIGILCGLRAAVRLNEGAGEYAARVAHVRGDQDAVFDLLDAVLGSEGETPPAPEQGGPPEVTSPLPFGPEGPRPSQPNARSRAPHGRPMSVDRRRRRGSDEPDRREPSRASLR